MAGQKETPRQKMIGMMYLVLTALLALQVSNSVLERFIFINRVLEKTNVENLGRNDEVLKRIGGVVEEKGNREEDLAVLNKAKEVRDETQKVFGVIEDYKKTFIEMTGGRDEESGQLKGAKDEDKVANYMILQGKGEELKATINSYVSFLREKTGDDDFRALALDAADDPVFKDDPAQRNKDFSELYFQKTPMAAGLATLSHLEAEIINYESSALDDLAQQVGAKDVDFDEIIVMVRPESNTVAAGARYKADMFIAASASGTAPVMYLNNKEIPVDGSFGKVEFVTTGGDYDENNTIKKSFNAKIEIPGVDSAYTSVIEYFVAKPVIRVQAQAVAALYLNCGNEINVDVPALGAEYAPEFGARGAQVIAGTGGNVTLVPSKKNVELDVSSKGNFIGTEKFKVRTVPKPTIELKSRGRKVDERSGMAVPGPRSLDIKAVADADFASFLPKDARYRVTEWEVTLARGTRPVDRKRVNAENVSLSSFAAKARAGDRIVVEVKKVQRMNFQGNREDVNIGTVIKTIPLH